MVRARAWRNGAVGPDRLALAGIGVVLVVIALSGPSGQPEGRDVDFGAVWLLAVAAGFAALGRRLPATGAVVNLVVAVVWHQIGYTSGIVNVPYLVAFYLLGASGDRRRELAVAGGAVVALTVAIVAAEDASATSAASAIGWTVAAVLLGELTHHRRMLLAEYEQRALQAEADRDREAERRVAQARLEIARDLHDILAHTVSVMTVQAGVARDALSRADDAHAAAALETIRGAGRDAMREVQALVEVLREPAAAAGTAPAPRLDRLADLAAATRAAGVEVDLDVDVPPTVPDVAQLTAYRVVQEGLTNVVRHAAARHAEVAVRHQGGALLVRVRDDGVGAPPEAEGGFGLRGMRERVEALGGTLDVGPRRSGGWSVLARIPEGDG